MYADFNKKSGSFVRNARNLQRVLSNVLIIIVKMQTIKAVSAHLMNPSPAGPPHKLASTLFAVAHRDSKKRRNYALYL